MSDDLPFIRRPVTPDGLVGYDQFNQFWGGVTKSWGGIEYHPVAHLLGKTCSLCDREWVATSESLLDQIKIDSLQDYVHESCYARHRRLENHLRLTSLMAKAKVSQWDRHWQDDHQPRNRNKYAIVLLKQIENQYWPDAYKWDRVGAPWYEMQFCDFNGVHTADTPDHVGAPFHHTIVCGPRKRVYSLQLNGLSQEQIEKLKISFEDVTDTKGIDWATHSYYIHAYTDDQIVRYLTSMVDVTGIREALQ